MSEMITADKATEFIRKALDAWAHTHGVKLAFNHPLANSKKSYLHNFLQQGMNLKSRNICQLVWFDLV